MRERQIREREGRRKEELREDAKEEKRIRKGKYAEERRKRSCDIGKGTKKKYF